MSDLAESADVRFLFAHRGSRRAGGVPLHRHAFWQFELFLGGRAEAVVGDEPLTPATGDALLIAPGIAHRFAYPAAGAAWVSVKFAAPPPTDPVEPALPSTAEVRAVVAAIAALVPPGGEPEPAQRGALGHLLAALLALATQRPGIEGGFAGRVRRLVGRDPARAWTVAGVARAFDMTPGHCSARFRAETGMALKGWLDGVRAAAAQRLLAGSDLAIGDVAAATGFPDLFAFSRFFARVVGASPRAWRRRHEGQGPTSDVRRPTSGARR